MLDVGVDVAAELRSLLHAVTAPDGERIIVSRLARRLTGRVAVVEASTAGDAVPAAIVADLTAVSDGRAAAVSTQVDGCPAYLLPIGAGAGSPVLMVLGSEPGQRFCAEERDLLTAAAACIGLVRQARAARHRQIRLEVAEAHNREAVLHLLMVGATAAARRAAAALGPRLPDMVRLHLVECAGRRVDDAARRAAASADTAWIVRCPVYTRHVIVIAPAEDATVAGMLREMAADDPAYHVGSSLAAPLGKVASAYRQAFHALSVARHRADRYAGFRARGELSGLLVEVGAGWAARTLAPLLSYRPARPQDPDADELIATLTSWLDFNSRAARHLKVHRNTLAARLRQIGSLLGDDLAEVPTQARLALALQLRGGPGDPTVTLDELLASPECRSWAEHQLEPLRGSDPRLLDTLRAWISHRAQIAPTAEALRVSASAVRKRLLRIETLTQRSLLDSPSARYDLALALEGCDPARSTSGRR